MPRKLNGELSWISLFSRQKCHNSIYCKADYQNPTTLSVSFHHEITAFYTHNVKNHHWNLYTLSSHRARNWC
jgi:hypothetical protein